ncbi:unnamed protein product [Lactuca saligna]|uniref:Uncharacterized protein n=1 Tax=Lactuca saligna TaxID=75948 RepID=A0AA36E150_LACSI|nr:unnamed protein product [Lactuca saligna]
MFIKVIHNIVNLFDRMIMSTKGDVGQCIRDAILIVQALTDYIKSDMDIGVYWNTLNSNGITKERLLSYDSPIRNEPKFTSDQKEGLLRDLGNYMRTLKFILVLILKSAISNYMDYRSEGKGFMVGVKINPISGLPSGFPELLQFVLEHVEDKNVEPLLEGLLEARAELKPLLSTSNDRLKDLVFMDIALDSTVRTAIERSYEELKNANPEKIRQQRRSYLLLEGMGSSTDHVENKGDFYHQLFQPSAEYLGALLGLDQWVSIFTQEMIRSASAACLSSLMIRLDPILCSVANLGSWQVISPVEAVGYIVVVDELLSV